MQFRRQIRGFLVAAADVRQKTQEHADSQWYARGSVRVQNAQPQFSEKPVHGGFVIIVNVGARMSLGLYQARGETDEQRSAFVNLAVEKYRFDRAADQRNFGGLGFDIGAGSDFVVGDRMPNAGDHSLY